MTPETASVGRCGEAEYVYLGGHRIAWIEPNNSVTIPGCGSGVPSGGCTVAAHGKWETVAVNWILLISPGLFVLGFIFKKKGYGVKGAMFVILIAGGIVITSYVFSSAQTDQFKIYYFLNDHLDTPQKIVDQLASVANETKLDPFGNVFNEYGTPTTNFRFPGQYHDRESGMYNNWNRYYLPSAGRYTRVDPLDNSYQYSNLFTFSSSMEDNNIYTYTRNNPINFIDIRGLKCCSKVEVSDFISDQLTALWYLINGENPMKYGKGLIASSVPFIPWVFTEDAYDRLPDCLKICVYQHVFCLS